MWRYFTKTGRYRWIDILPDLMTAYNASVHRSIGMPPANVTEDEEHELWRKQEVKGPQKVSAREPKTRFLVGDEVRLSKAKQVFANGYLPTWTEEIFTVSQVLNALPAQYKAKDYRNEEIVESFYGPEPAKVVRSERYAIERVIRRRHVRGRMQYFVKWYGFKQ